MPKHRWNPKNDTENRGPSFRRVTFVLCRHYFGDQFGDSFCPSVVNCRSAEPSASIDQICRVPVRVDSNTMCRPSGAQLGRSLRPASRVSSTRECVAMSIT